MKPTGVPDGSQEMPKVMRPRAIDREGRKDPNIADNLPAMVEGSEPMHDNLRKGAFGAPICGKGPTNMPNEEEFIPMAGEQSAEKFGLGKGQYGAI